MTKKRLLAAATHAFARAGFQGTPARALENAAKVERGLLAYHFGSKEGLWRAVIDRLAGRVGDTLRRVYEARDPNGDAIEAIVRALIVANAETPEYMRMIVVENGHRTALIDYAIDKHIRRFLDAVEGAVGRRISAHDYYALIGASSFFFISPREAKRIWNVDPGSERFLAEQTRIVADLLRSRWANADTPSPEAFSPGPKAEE